MVAKKAGARIVHVALRGYGSALSAGINAAVGRFIIIGDADESYDFTEIDRFLIKLRAGNEFVMGTKIRGAIEAGAMPKSHRYLGTPILTSLINVFFGTKFSDCNCGVRGFTRDGFLRLNIETTGMEWASETIIKSSLIKLKMSEVPVTLRVDKRDRCPHLRAWRDGWYHLRFILTYAADKILFVPGCIGLIIGLIGFLLFWQHPIIVCGFFMDYHFLFPSAMLVMLGVQMILFTFLTKTYTGLAAYNKRLSGILKSFTFEYGIILGTLLVIVGLGIDIVIVLQWIHSHMQGLFAVRPAIIALTITSVGFQLLFNFFFLSVLQIPQERVVAKSSD